MNTEYDIIKKKLDIAEKKIRILEDMVENNSRELYFYTQELQSRNKEKDTLLKEIHHRVKNNLQIIIGLLAIQSHYIKENELKTIFSTSQMRINSMALVHEMLYQTEDFAKINYKNYIRELFNSLMESYSSDKDVILKIECSDIHFSIDTAVPLGLILNEIISNSLKHAFNSISKGLIFIKLSKKDQIYTLEIGDNGLGINNFKVISKQSLGLLMIKKLSRQLGGNIKMDSLKKGTNYILTFREVELLDEMLKR